MYIPNVPMYAHTKNQIWRPPLINLILPSAWVMQGWRWLLLLAVVVAIFRVLALHAQTNCQRSSFQQPAQYEVQCGPYGWLESKVAWEIATYCESRNADESQVLTLACAQHCINECFIMILLLQEIWTFCINCPRGMSKLVVIKLDLFKDIRTGIILLYEITHHSSSPL